MGGVRAEDRKNLAIGFFSLFALMAAHALSETARDALFLGRLDADQLPWAYLAIAGLALVVVRFNQRLLDKAADKRKLLGASLLFAAVVDVGWGLAPLDARNPSCSSRSTSGPAWSRRSSWFSSGCCSTTSSPSRKPNGYSVLLPPVVSLVH